MSLVEINEKNPQKSIFNINDEKFRVYGKVLEDYNISEISNCTKKNIAIPEQ